eukprot:scaffold317341_cov15-Tisochrysis_lutea.AAC.1
MLDPCGRTEEDSVLASTIGLSNDFLGPKQPMFSLNIHLLLLQTNFAPMLATAAKAQLGAPTSAPSAPASAGTPAPQKEADKHHIVLMELLSKELGVQ